MKKSISLMFGLVLSLSLFSAHGQTTADAQRAQQIIAEQNRQLQIQRQNQQAAILSNIEQGRQYETTNTTRSGRIGSYTPSIKLTKEQKEKLKPNNQDLVAYGEFLKQPNTGLIKLFQDKGCEGGAYVIRVDAECSNWIPTGGFYSFRKDKHTKEDLADIRYKNGFLISDALLAQGLMTSLGNIPLENVSLATDQIQQVAQYKPEPQNNLAAVQVKKLVAGIKLGNYSFSNTWRASGNTTYVLRVIAYRGAFVKIYQGMPIDVLEGDRRKDVIVAFRIVSENLDGSVTIVWKELSQQDSPKIAFQKKENK